jgi:hypothetical protein
VGGFRSLQSEPETAAKGKQPPFRRADQFNPRNSYFQSRKVASAEVLERVFGRRES